MSFNLKGTLIDALPEVTGVSKAGKPWRKREYIMSILSGQFPRNIVFSVFGDAIDQFNTLLGGSVDCDVNIESNESNGRWYTRITAWRLNTPMPNTAIS